MYSREINGKEFSFGVSGKLIMNVLVMYDRQTESLWSQLLGVAVQGEMIGTQLEYLPSWQTSWADWKARHPNTLALVKGYSGNVDVYDSYYASGSSGVIGRNNIVLEGELYAKEFVVGIEYKGEAFAYPFSTLNERSVINHTLADEPVLVVFDIENANGAVFNRTVDGEVLTFSLKSGTTIIDNNTNSTWNGITGVAVDGPMQGTVLLRLKSTTIFWFGWSDFFPETGVYRIEDFPTP